MMENWARDELQSSRNLQRNPSDLPESDFKVQKASNWWNHAKTNPKNLQKLCQTSSFSEIRSHSSYRPLETQILDFEASPIQRWRRQGPFIWRYGPKRTPKIANKNQGWLIAGLGCTSCPQGCCARRARCSGPRGYLRCLVNWLIWEIDTNATEKSLSWACQKRLLGILKSVSWAS